MGNYISCSLSTQLGCKTPKSSTKVILPTGEIRQIDGPTKAAELMLDSPNFFVANSQSLKIGRRFSPLSADEDLEFGNVYTLFPMKRANSIVTAADLKLLFLAANSAAKKRGNKVRDSQDDRRMAGQLRSDDEWRESDETVTAVPKLNLEDMEEFSSPVYVHRLSMSRSKRPLLETIAE